MRPPVDTVKAFYAAPASGDVPSRRGMLSDDLQWAEAKGFPYYSGTWNSGEDLLEKLLKPLMRDWDDFSARPEEFIGQNDRVIRIGAYSGRFKATGKTMHAAFAQAWRVRKQKIARIDKLTHALLIHRAMC